MDKNWLDFGDLDLILKVIVGRWLVCTLSPEGMDRFFTKLVQLYNWDMDKN